MKSRSQRSKILLNTVGAFVYLFALWLMSIVLVRLANYEAAGVFSIALTISNVFVCISNYGMKGYQVSDVDFKYSDTHYINSRLLTVLAGLGLCVGFSVLKGYTGETLVVITTFMVYRSIEAAAEVLHGIFQKNDRLDCVGISLSLKGIVSLAVFFPCMVLFKSLGLAITSMCLATLGIFVFYDMAVASKYVKTYLDFASVNRRPTLYLLRDSFLMMMFSITSPLLLSIPRIYFERKYSTELFGVFSSIAAPTIVITTLVSAVLVPIIPQFARYYNDHNRSKLLRISGMTITCTVAFGAVCYVGSLILGDFALTVLFGASILKYSAVLGPVVVVTSLSAIIMCFYTFFVATRRLLELFISSLVPCVVCYLIAPSLIDKHEMFGITHSMILSQLVQIVLMSAIVVWVVKKMPTQTG
jgi:O-antigen/teichoic acid export membrane protein